MANLPRIAITPGEPAGIGPDIVIQVAQLNFPAQLIVIADPNLLLTRAKKLSIPLDLTEIHFADTPIAHRTNHLFIVPESLKTNVVSGQLNKKNAPYVLSCLQKATELCKNKIVDALVTGPIQKSIMNEAGIPFSGHTEFLAEQCESETIMLFAIDNMKIALVTTHIPLSQVSASITKEKLFVLLQILNNELKNKFKIKKPKIFVTGLNPHAGENGHLGNEEIETIIPAIKKANSINIDAEGPFPADTIFTQKYINSCDVILAMYHDQALPVIKFFGFDRAVNITLGLPIIRTSVDHGTALDIAGTLQANPSSLVEAVKLAINLANK